MVPFLRVREIYASSFQLIALKLVCLLNFILLAMRE